MFLIVVSVTNRGARLIIIHPTEPPINEHITQTAHEVNIYIFTSHYLHEQVTPFNYADSALSSFSQGGIKAWTMAQIM